MPEFTWSLRYVSRLALTVLMLAGITWNAAADEGSNPGDWEKYLEVYGWLPNLYITTASQDHMTITVGDVISNPKMFAFVDFGAKSDNWSYGVDSIYMHIGASEDVGGEFLGKPVNGKIDLDMRAFVSTANAGYQISHTDDHELSLIGGVRYCTSRCPWNLIWT